MDTADRLRDTGDLVGALAHYRAAHGMMHVPTTGLEVARVQAALGQLVEARATAIETAHLPVWHDEPEVFAHARRAAEDLAEQLAPEVPSLITQITPRDASCALEIDDVAIPEAARAVPFKTNPGEHTVVVTAPGYRSVRMTIALARGESRRLAISLVAQPAARAPSQSLAPGTDPASGARLRAQLALAVGGALLGAGAVTGVLSLLEARDARRECHASLCPVSLEPRLERANTLANVANVSLPLGVLALGYGLYELLTLPETPAGSDVSAISIEISPRGPHMTWRGRL